MQTNVCRATVHPINPNLKLISEAAAAGGGGAAVHSVVIAAFNRSPTRPNVFFIYGTR
jgi:hypothetical protein